MFKDSDLRDLTNEICDAKAISASLGPLVSLLCEVAGKVISDLISSGKQVSGWHSLYLAKRIEIIQAAWKDARTQFTKSHSDAIKKHEADGKKVSGYAKVYEAGVCIVDRVS